MFEFVEAAISGLIDGILPNNLKAFKPVVMMLVRGLKGKIETVEQTSDVTRIIGKYMTDYARRYKRVKEPSEAAIGQLFYQLTKELNEVVGIEGV